MRLFGHLIHISCWLLLQILQIHIRPSFLNVTAQKFPYRLYCLNVARRMVNWTQCHTFPNQWFRPNGIIWLLTSKFGLLWHLSRDGNTAWGQSKQARWHFLCQLSKSRELHDMKVIYPTTRLMSRNPGLLQSWNQVPTRNLIRTIGHQPWCMVMTNRIFPVIWIQVHICSTTLTRKDQPEFFFRALGFQDLIQGTSSPNRQFQGLVHSQNACHIRHWNPCKLWGNSTEKQWWIDRFCPDGHGHHCL